MPIYEYRCDDCGHEFETIQKISESPLQTCPSCERDTLIKKISAAGFRLKGSGWYETDFKSGNKRNVADGESSGSEGSDGGSSGKDSDAKDSRAKGNKIAAGESSGSDSASKAASSSGSESGSSKSSGAAKSSKTDSSS